MTRGQENVDEEHERSPGVPLANLEELRGDHRALREVHNNHLAVDIFFFAFIPRCVLILKRAEKFAKRRVLCFLAALWAFAFRPLLGVR